MYFDYANLILSQVLLTLQVYFGWRKITEEFLKRMDPDLPFFYHTSKHSCFYEGLMPDFSVKPAKKRKPK